MAFSSYAWAAGHGVALASLKNVENELFPYNYQTTGGARFNVGITSPPVDRFPVRTRVQAGYELGDGFIDHSWDMKLTATAVDYVLTTYLSSGATTYAAMTIYTRRHDLDDYARYNCYLALPKPGQDMEYLRGRVLRSPAPYRVMLPRLRQAQWRSQRIFQQTGVQ